MRRGAATWCSYLMLGSFTYLLVIQGNILPPLQEELGLSYRAASLHASAIAAGMILVGLFGARVIRRFGRKACLLAGGGGIVAGGLLLCFAPAAWASIASCFVIGAVGSLVPAMVPAMLADLHEGHAEIAFAEANAMCQVYAIAAPIAVGLAIDLEIGWRSAVLLGAAVCALLLFSFGRVPLPAGAPPAGASGRLPGRFWAWWALVGIGCAIEFSVLVWSPAFLERSVGFSPAGAAMAASAFAVAMLIGRAAGSLLVRRVPAPVLYPAALVIAAFGFALYWGGSGPMPAVAGLFVLGLGVALLYPLGIGFAMSAAGAERDAASARFMLAVGTALLTMPTLLGALADAVGLRSALLLIPVLIAITLAGFLLARLAERRAALPVWQPLAPAAVKRQ